MVPLMRLNIPWILISATLYFVARADFPEDSTACDGAQHSLCYAAAKRRCRKINSHRLYRIPKELISIDGRTFREEVTNVCFPCVHPLDAYAMCCNRSKYGPEGNPACWGWIPEFNFFARYDGCCVKEQPDPKMCTQTQLCWDPPTWQPMMPQLLRWGVSSQSTQDSVLAFFFSIIGVTNAIFVEFGYISADGSNTELLSKMVFRHHCGASGQLAPRVVPLVVVPHWSGLLLDIAQRGPNVIREEIRMDTVVSVFRRRGVPLEPDYVSVDIDSCDLWVFLCMTGVFRPRLLSVEYNRRFPLDASAAADCLSIPPADGESIQYLRGHGASILAIAQAAWIRNYHVAWVTETDVFLIRGEEFCANSSLPSPEQQVEPFKSWTGDTSVLWLRLHPGRLVDVNRTLTTWGREGLEAACRDPAHAAKSLYVDQLPTVFNPP